MSHPHPPRRPRRLSRAGGVGPGLRLKGQQVQGEWIKITWWESFRVDFAARKAGGATWHWESFTISRRLDSAGTPIGGWALNGTELQLSCEMLPENAGD